MNFRDTVDRGGQVTSWDDVATRTLRRRQHQLTRAPQNRARQQALDATPASDDKARLRACGGPGAGAWLAPPAGIGDEIDDRSFRMLLRMRLGQMVAPPGFLCARRSAAGAACQEWMDSRGDHAHRCRLEGWRLRRHNAVQHAIAQILRNCDVGVLEHPVRVPEWDRVQADGTRLAAVLDLRIERGPGGPVRYADIVVPHPVGPTNTPSASLTDGASATAAENTKYDRYGQGVLPLAVETFGRWGTQALKWWRQLAKQVVAMDPHLAAAGRWAIPSLLQRWWRQVSVALQRANADSVFASLGQVRSFGPWEAGTLPEVHELLLPMGGIET